MITFEKFDLNNYDNCLVVTDVRLSRLYSVKGDNVFILPEGERSKSFGNVEKLCKWFLSKGLERSGRVIAVGGGSIGDVVGFAASVYKRGVKLTHVPTTLLAQIDSAIGGKTAIDLDGVKNAVGSFYFADTVVDVRFLNTLSEAQMQNGRGELLKYEMLSEEIEKVKCGVEDLVKACAKYKDSVCKSDPYDDSGVREKLNFGHTVGHALELLYGIPHGVAVANGIFYETEIARLTGRCDVDYAEKWKKRVCDGFRLYPVTEQAVELMKNDKKNANGKICFVLPKNFSRAELDVREVYSILLNA